MITISLDDQGVFEQGGPSSDDVVMIAGIVYDDKNDVFDANREKTRIKNYFKSVCKNTKATYPQALHAGHGHDSEVRRVKSEYNKTLGEFLKTGKYKGQVVASGIWNWKSVYFYALE